MAQAAFEYKAVDRSGISTHGVVRAATAQEAYRRIAAGGVTPTKISPARDDPERGPSRRWRSRVTPQDIAHFTYQLSVLLEARISVVDCFRSIADQEPNPAFRRVILDIAASVQAGKTITDAISAHRHLFGDVYVETIRAAEAGGNMIKVLAHLAEQVEDQTEMRRMIKGAMMYPATVIAALSLGTAFLVTFVVPKFATMFRSRGVKLPVLTEALDRVGSSVTSYWYVYLASAVLCWGIVNSASKSTKSRLLIDRCLHRIPHLGGVLTGLAVGRFSSVFGLCLSSGLGLIDTLEMAGKASGRPMLIEDTRLMVRQVKSGGKLGDVMQQCLYIPPFVKQLFRAGEESAELGRMCQIITRHYSRETKHLVKNASTIIEPVLIALLTGVVLMVALAIFLPMWNMVSLMQ